MIFKFSYVIIGSGVHTMQCGNLCLSASILGLTSGEDDGDILTDSVSAAAAAAGTVDVLGTEAALWVCLALSPPASRSLPEESMVAVDTDTDEDFLLQHNCVKLR